MDYLVVLSSLYSVQEANSPIDSLETTRTLPILALNEIYIGESLSSRVSYLELQVLNTVTGLQSTLYRFFFLRWIRTKFSSPVTVGCVSRLVQVRTTLQYVSTLVTW